MVITEVEELWRGRQRHRTGPSARLMKAHSADDRRRHVARLRVSRGSLQRQLLTTTFSYRPGQTRSRSDYTRRRHALQAHLRHHMAPGDGLAHTRVTPGRSHILSPRMPMHSAAPQPNASSPHTHAPPWRSKCATVHRHALHTQTHAQHLTHRIALAGSQTEDRRRKKG